MVKRWWRDFWRSPVSWAVDPEADAEPLYHWARTLQKREELLDTIEREGWTVAGSQSWIETDVVVGGPDDGAEVERRVRSVVAHPLLNHVKHLDNEIAKLREAFGRTPMARFRLQMQFTESKRSELALGRELAREAPPSAEVIDLEALE